jgi:MarR family transcriptional regulator, organic hydroperoxide resistance regulator
LLSWESNFYNITRMNRSKPPKPHLALLLERASRVVSDRLDKHIGQDGVTADHWRVLRHLADGLGHAMGEIAERERINPPTLTKLIDRMVGKSLVQRAADAEDSRRVLVYATDAGLEMLDELEVCLHDHHAALDALLGPRNTRQLERLLTLLVEGSERPTA